MRDPLLLRPKALYFALNAMVYSTYSFTPLYLKSRWSVADHFYGYAVALSVVGFPGSLLWTAVADRTGRCRGVLVATTVGFAASFLALGACEPLSASWSDATRTSFVCASFGASNFFSSALYPLVDRIVFATLSRDSAHSLDIFGRQRLWGILGQSAVTAALGYAISATSLDAIFVFFLAWLAVFLLLVIATVPAILRASRRDGASVANEQQAQSDCAQKTHDDVAKSVPVASDAPQSSPDDSAVCAQTTTAQHADDAAKAPSVARLSFYSRNIAPLLAFSRAFYAFIVAVLIAGVVRGVLGNFLTPFFANVLHLTPRVSGYVLQSRLITEVAMFFAGTRLITAWGAPAVFQLGAATGVIRAAAYAIVPGLVADGPGRVVLPVAVETLKGVNNACTISAGVRIAHDLAPHGLEAVAQGAFSGVHAYLANAASGCFGGLVLQFHTDLAGDDADAYVCLFRYTAALGLAGVLLYAFSRRFC